MCPPVQDLDPRGIDSGGRTTHFTRALFTVRHQTDTCKLFLLTYYLADRLIAAQFIEGVTVYIGIGARSRGEVSLRNMPPRQGTQRERELWTSFVHTKHKLPEELLRP